MKLIGIDIGGTKCAVCFGETDGKGGVNMQRAAAPRKTEGVKPEEMLRLLAEDVETLVSGERERPAAVGISCGSPMDSKRGIILSPPNLPGWDHVEITAFLRRISESPPISAMMQMRVRLPNGEWAREEASGILFS
jgi:glucokinase